MPSSPSTLRCQSSRDEFAQPRTRGPLVTVSSKLHIGLLGDFRLVYDDESVAAVSGARLQSLLAYLVLASEARHRREHVAFTFWPDSTEEQARTNLRQLLHRLRQALPESERFIEADTQIIRWRDDAPFTLDVKEFERVLARASETGGGEQSAAELLAEAVRLYRGDLLPSCYDGWIEPHRDRLRDAYIRGLEQLVHLMGERGDYSEATRHCRQLLRKDPLREETYRTLMRLHAAERDHTSALRIYEELATTVKREFGAEPSAATRALYERLLSLETLQEPAAAAPFDLEFPLVGQRQQWERLLAAWHAAAGGKARFVAVTGEAGIGKTRLAEELLAGVAERGHTSARTRCYEAEGRLAYGPITEWLRSDALRTGLHWLDPAWMTELARVLPELLTEHPEMPRPAPLTEAWQRRHFFEALARAVLTAPRPLLLLVDDLQWCDRETLEWLRYLLHYAPREALLVVGTARTEELGAEHPFNAMLLQLRCGEQVDEIALGRLDRDQTAILAERVQDRGLSAERAAALYSQTEGNPLFIVETVRAGLPDITETLAEGNARPRSSFAKTTPLPPRAQAVITYRLAQLSSEARYLAEVAAVIGRDFTLDVLTEASALDEDGVVRAIDELCQRRIVREHSADAYDFAHDKLREAAYTEMSTARRRLLHRRVAEALESSRASDLDAASSQLAAHYELAALPKRAIPWYQKAAELAQRIHADEEAIVHITRALRLLEELPEGQARDAKEMALQCALGSSLITSRGWAASEVEKAYARARVLCEKHEKSQQLLPILWGLQAFYTVRPDLQRARQTDELLLKHAQVQDDATLTATARYTLAISLFHLGDLVGAHDQLGSAPAGCDARVQNSPLTQFGPLTGVLSLCYAAHTVWHLGFPDQALARSRAALALAEELNHPFMLAIAHAYAAMLHQFRDEPTAVRTRAEAAAALCDRYGVVYYRAMAEILRGWARAAAGESAHGIDEMRQGLADLLAMGAELRRPYYLGLLAGAYARAGQIEDGLTAVSEGLTVARRNEERWCEPELHRLEGELLHQRGDDGAAETSFLRALDRGRALQARALELRAATRLAHLKRGQERYDEVLDSLREVYDRYTEGLDTPELQAAAALLREHSPLT